MIFVDSTSRNDPKTHFVASDHFVLEATKFVLRILDIFPQNSQVLGCIMTWNAKIKAADTETDLLGIASFVHVYWVYKRK